MRPAEVRGGGESSLCANNAGGMAKAEPTDPRQTLPVDEPLPRCSMMCDMLDSCTRSCKRCIGHSGRCDCTQHEVHSDKPALVFGPKIPEKFGGEDDEPQGNASLQTLASTYMKICVDNPKFDGKTVASAVEAGNALVIAAGSWSRAGSCSRDRFRHFILITAGKWRQWELLTMRDEEGAPQPTAPHVSHHCVACARKQREPSRQRFDKACNHL